MITPFLRVAHAALFICITTNASEILYNGIEFRPLAPHPLETSSRPVETLPADPETPYYISTPPSAIIIDIGRQLFVDQFLIGNVNGLTRKAHNPVDHPANPIFSAANPGSWEFAGTNNKPFAAPYTDGLWWDPAAQKWKMWYMGGYAAKTGYAESADGINWTRNQNPVNTPLFGNADGISRDAGMVWLDLRPGVPAAERYKMSRYRAGLEIRTSADGVNFTEPLFTYNRNTQTPGDRTTFAFNPFRNKWVFLVRGQESKYSYSRYKRYAEGDSFTSPIWTDFNRLPHWLRADNLDRDMWDEGLDWEENVQTPDLYNFEMTPYESLMLGFFNVQAYEAEHDYTSDPPVQVAPYRPKHNYITLGYSRDGVRFSRPDRNVFLGPVDDPDRSNGYENTPWNWGNIQPVGGLFSVVGEELWIYYSARAGWGDPDGFFTAPFWDGTHSRMGLATMRRDGFVSYEAGTAGGTLTTRTLKFTHTNGFFFVNADVATGGSVQVEVLDANTNAVIPGFTRSDSSSATLNGAGSTRQSISFAGGNIGSLANRPLKFRFHVTNAKLYAFWVSNHPDGRSNGFVAQGGPGFRGHKDDGGEPVATAEVEVRGNGIVIPDGDTTPGTADGSSFGTVTPGAPAITRTFTVHNLGSSALHTTGVNVPPGFSLLKGLSAVIPPGGKDSIVIQLPAVDSGIFSGDISFGTNDADESLYNFRVAAIVTGSEVSVTGNGFAITDEDHTPYAGDHTWFGLHVQGAPPVTRTFTVTNTGASTLTLGSVTLPDGFYPGSDTLVSSLAPGASDTFSVTMPSSVIGVFDGDIRFVTNDNDENPFNFRIRGRVGPAGPMVTVSGNNVGIASGDTTPSLNDHTDFGLLEQNGTSVRRTFTVTNQGTATVSLDGFAVTGGFTTAGCDRLTTTLPPSGSDRFEVILPATAGGVHNGAVTFLVNNITPYTFSIAGKVGPKDGAPEIAVTGNTDFGAVTTGSTPVTRTFTVSNLGTATLTLGPVSLPAGFVSGGDPLVSSLEPGKSDTFNVTLPASSQGTFSGQISIATNDPDENPFTLAISGSVGTQSGKPTVSLLVTDAEAAESGKPAANPGVIRISRTGVASTPLTVYFSTGGTALYGASNDYTLIDNDGAVVTTSAVIDAGELHVDLIVLPVDNATIEASEAVTIAIKPNNAYLIGNASGTVTIADNEPVVTIVATDADAAESGTPPGNPGMIRINVSQAPAIAPLPVRFTLGGSTAIHPGDYTMVMINPDGSEGKVVGSPVSIPVGRTFVDIRIKPVDDKLANEPDIETVRVQLMISATNSYTLGAETVAIVSIQDNE